MPDAPAGDALAAARADVDDWIRRLIEDAQLIAPNTCAALVKRALDTYETAARAEGAAEEREKFLRDTDEDGQKVRDFMDRGAVVLCVNENGDVAVWAYGDFVADPNGPPLAVDGSPLTALYEAAARAPSSGTEAQP